MDSNVATVSITVNQVVTNHPPVANGQNVETNKNTPKNFILTGKDPDTGDTITFAIILSPSNGQISNFDKNTGKTYLHSQDGVHRVGLVYIQGNRQSWSR